VPADTNTLSTSMAEKSLRVSEWHRLLRVFFFRRLVLFSSIVVLAFVIVAVFAPLIAPYNPYKQNLNDVLAQPSREHLLGTDSLGRDTLSRIIYGARTSMLIAVITLVFAASIGMAIGLLAGYYGGWTNTIIMRFIDTLMSFPMLLLALIIAAMLGGGLKNIIIALGIGMLPGYARLMCGQVISVKENDYIYSERAIGASNMRIIFRHIFPNCLPPLIVLITMMMGLVILAEAGLSFLGIGIEPPAAAWGGMVSYGYGFLRTNPIQSIAPGLAIMLVVFAFNMVGDGLRDALDPRLRGVL
jgi:peptide/nickel transport system permease protein